MRITENRISVTTIKPKKRIPEIKCNGQRNSDKEEIPKTLRQKYR